MSRQLSDKMNAVRFWDPVSETWMTLHYRAPTTEERFSYQNDLVKRNGSKVVFQPGEVQGKYGLKIFAGFAEGAFADENGALFASDKSSPIFREDWKALVNVHASDIISWLARFVFDPPFSVEKEDIKNPL